MGLILEGEEIEGGHFGAEMEKVTSSASAAGVKNSQLV